MNENELEQPVSKARERQRRRKERELKRQGVKTPSRRLNQIRPSSDGTFELPQINLGYLRHTDRGGCRLPTPVGGGSGLSPLQLLLF